MKEYREPSIENIVRDPKLGITLELIGDPVVAGSITARVVLRILLNPGKTSFPVAPDIPEYTLPQYFHQN